MRLSRTTGKCAITKTRCNESVSRMLLERRTKSKVSQLSVSSTLGRLALDMTLHPMCCARTRACMSQPSAPETFESSPFSNNTSITNQPRRLNFALLQGPSSVNQVSIARAWARRQIGDLATTQSERSDAPPSFINIIS